MTMAGEMITKPDTNPILVAVLNLFLLGGVGYFLMGQQKKAIISIVAFLLTSWCGLAIVVAVVTAYDAYLLGQKLQRGESIGQSENGLSFLNSIPGFHD
jgi:TM2 domain-containing membrane protein YozV